jgi:cytoskeleton protein RodZ
VTTVAEVLKQERETQGISLEEVAQKTYIKLHYLHALEEDRPDLLPAPVYTCGYIRQYAKLLGLNGADLVNIYQSQHKPREYSIVRNASALAPEVKADARPIEATEVEAIPAAVRHEMPVAAPVARPAAALSATALPPAPVTPAPAAATNGAASTPAPALAEVAAPAPLAPAPVTPAPRPQAAPVVAPSRPAAPVAAEPAAQPMEVRIDTRDALMTHPDAEKILVLARQQADDILAKAREEAARLRQGAEQYADQVLSQLESDVGRTLAVIRNGRSHLQSRSRVRRTPEPRVSERSAEASAT